MEYINIFYGDDKLSLKGFYRLRRKNGSFKCNKENGELESEKLYKNG